ncbi:hypothetical protein KRX51_07375 [Corynebacterium sp. TAE3-ERU12]|uniref:hypothetical protein n=1 Tax=Corynebacterium sp. TAE3-ERU12 TaxID=2849491 RepID=UPI001C47EE20|nr:hypothetical protein [Corynebacterium sp. TAE3-ERU12]MBV7295733.1 hypothetical protein [Corynebacterium sp. TAE3-ERU12]
MENNDAELVPADHADNRSGTQLSTAAVSEIVSSGLDKALLAQQPLAMKTVARLRRVHPDKSPEDLIKYINKTYLSTVTASGTGSGMAAVVPNGAVQVPAAILDLMGFLEASVFYVLAISEIYGLDTEDFERRRFLVLAALLGNSGTQAVTQALGERTVPYWSKQIISRIPGEALKRANKVLGPRFITRYGTRQGVLVLGKQLPLAIGAVVGASGNAAFGTLVIRSTKKLLSPPPADWSHLDG